MNTKHLHQTLTQKIADAPTQIDAELVAIAASALSAELREQTSVDLGSWDERIREDFHPDLVVEAVAERIEGEMSMLCMPGLDPESWDYLVQGMLDTPERPTPVSVPNGPVSLFDRTYPSVERMASQLVIASGDSALSHCLAFVIVSLADDLFGLAGTTFLPVLDGPDRLEWPGQVCRRAQALYGSGQEHQAQKLVAEYIKPVNR